MESDTMEDRPNDSGEVGVVLTNKKKHDILNHGNSQTEDTCMSDDINPSIDKNQSQESSREKVIDVDQTQNLQGCEKSGTLDSDNECKISENSDCEIINGECEAIVSENIPESMAAAVTVEGNNNATESNTNSIPDLSGDNSDDLLSELESELQSTSETYDRTRPEANPTEDQCSEHNSSDTGAVENCDAQGDIGRTKEGVTIMDISTETDQETVITETVKSTNSSTLQAGEKAVVIVQSDTTVLTSRVQCQSMTESSASQGDKSSTLPNGVIPTVNIKDIPEFKELQSRYDTLQKLYIEKEVDTKRLQEEVQKTSDELRKAGDETAVHLKKIDTLSNQNNHQACEEQVKQLDEKLSSQSKDLVDVKSRLVSQDAAARKHIHQLQSDLQGKLSQVSRAYEECKRDKEGMVVKYAMGEQKNIELMEKLSRSEKWIKDMEREREQAIVKYKQMKTDREKSEGVVLARGQEIVNMRREIDKQKELRAETESKCKWANARLKQELEAHKEMKGKHEELNKKYQLLFDNMKEKQQSEDVKKMTLAVQLDEKENALRQQQQEKTDQEEVHHIVKAELENLKRKHKEMMEELRTYKDKVTCLEAERLHQEETLTKFKDTLQTQKKEHAELCQRIGELEQAGQQLGKARDQIEKLKTHLSDLEESNRDLRAEMENCAKREGGHLEFTKKVSDKNARLQSENSALTNKLTSLQSEHEQLQTKCTNLEEKIANLEGHLNQENQQRINENGTLSAKLEDKTQAVKELTQQLEDQKDENKTLKRRHQANIKDLSRQLQLAKRKLDASSQKNGERDSQSLGSMGSRTSSVNSLNTLGEGGGGNHVGVQGSGQEIQAPLPQEEEQPIVQFVEVDKQVLVDKIVKLQRQAARKNEKLEFMEDHINQLVEELQRKAKIIQNYALREEAGTLTPEEVDLNKIQLSKKSGIMASVYSRHLQDDHMTMDLSLEINRKLQAVLEDTLLKNITLKENMDTLGGEIAKLSHSNRDLQLDIQRLQTMLADKT